MGGSVKYQFFLFAQIFFCKEVYLYNYIDKGLIEYLLHNVVESQAPNYTREVFQWGFQSELQQGSSVTSLFLTLCLQMEETDLSERGLPQLTSIMHRVRNLKNKYKNEENITDEFHYTKLSADTTGIWFCFSAVTYAKRS